MPRKIALVVHALHGGGAERVAAMMSSQWACQGDQVTLITLDTVESDHYRVDPAVQRVGLGVMGVSSGLWQAVANNRDRIQKLRDALAQAAPRCVVSVTDQMNVLTLLAARPLRLPVVIAEHSDPRHQRMSAAWEWLRRWTYPRAAAVVALTHPVADFLRQIAGPSPVHVIPNAVHTPPQTATPTDLHRNRMVSAMGRLSREKGFDLLIDAFASIARQLPEWQLEIAGDGPERAALQNLINQHSLGTQVRLIGWIEHPDDFLTRSALFVLSSRYEGFPVALMEAMACGLPVVSCDCDSGPREIIRHEQDGLLVPAENAHALAAAMAQLMQEPERRAQLGQRAREVTVRFSPELFRERWNCVIDSVTGRLDG